MTRYEYGESGEYVEISDKWSRKSIQTAMGDGGLLWTLNNKCDFFLIDENEKEVTPKTLTEEAVTNFDILLHSWLSETIVRHIDFLLQSVTKESEE